MRASCDIAHVNTLAALTIADDTPARFTSEQFMQLVEVAPIKDWLGKVELVRGIIVHLAPAHIPHWTAQRAVMLALHEALKDMSRSWIVGQEPTVRLDEDTIRQPDVAVLRWDARQADIFERDQLLLAIEIADSSLQIDLHGKRHSYAAAGIPHYWVVDIDGREIHLMSDPAEGDYCERKRVPFGTRIDVPGTDRTIVID
jgi:Uma2 family endonuclease